MVIPSLKKETKMKRLLWDSFNQKKAELFLDSYVKNKEFRTTGKENLKLVQKYRQRGADYITTLFGKHDLQ